MNISLIITTCNRSLLLQDALESIAASDVAEADEIEVIVVDNNSEDDTPGVVERFQSSGFPFELRYCLEHERGLSVARNRGITESSAEYVVFMDDDQRIERGYLARVASVFAKTGAAAVGGPVKYYNATAIPRWAGFLIADFGQFHAGTETRALAPDERLLNGGNMAVKRSVLHEVGGFDLSLGRRGQNLLANEDQEIQRRILAAGYTVFYSPELLQYHYLSEERLTKRYWRRHHFGHGRTMYRESRAMTEQPKGTRLFGAPRWFWSSLVVCELPRYLRSLIGAASPEQTFDRQLDIFVMLGRIYEARHSRHAPSRQAP